MQNSSFQSATIATLFEGKQTMYSKDTRYWFDGADAARLWLANPVSEGGAKQIFRMVYGLLGPEIHRLTAGMHSDPEAARLLHDKPDLGKVLADTKALKAMPAGSLGREYADFMDCEDVLPGYILGGLAYKDGRYDRLADWAEDAKFLVTRVGNTHDLMHVLAGYGSDFAGESFIVPFTLSSAGLPVNLVLPWAMVWAAFTWVAVQPPVGLYTWLDIVRDGVMRGATMAARRVALSVYYEELLALPLQDARQRLGLPPHQHRQFVNSKGFLDSSTWVRGRFGHALSTGFGSLAKSATMVRMARRLIEDGVPIRLVMSGEPDRLASAFALWEAGHSREEVMTELKR